MNNPFRFFNAKSQFEVSKLWAAGLTYKGFDLFEIFHNGNKPLDKHYNKLYAEVLGMHLVTDCQEGLLAYYSQSDTFVLGFDVWKEKYRGDGLETGGATVRFTIDENRKVKVVEAYEESEMVYDEGGLYEELDEMQTKDAETVIFIYTK